MKNQSAFLFATALIAFASNSSPAQAQSACEALFKKLDGGMVIAGINKMYSGGYREWGVTEQKPVIQMAPVTTGSVRANYYYRPVAKGAADQATGLMAEVINGEVRLGRPPESPSHYGNSGPDMRWRTALARTVYGTIEAVQIPPVIPPSIPSFARPAVQRIAAPGATTIASTPVAGVFIIGMSDGGLALARAGQSALIPFDIGGAPMAHAAKVDGAIYPFIGVGENLPSTAIQDLTFIDRVTYLERGTGIEEVRHPSARLRVVRGDKVMYYDLTNGHLALLQGVP